MSSRFPAPSRPPARSAWLSHRLAIWRADAAKGDPLALPKGSSPHGLRKAAAVRLAEAGATSQEIMAITGHTTLAEVERYTRDVAQKRLAESAMARLERGPGKG